MLQNCVFDGRAWTRVYEDDAAPASRLSRPAALGGESPAALGGDPPPRPRQTPRPTPTRELVEYFKAYCAAAYGHVGIHGWRNTTTGELDLDDANWRKVCALGLARDDSAAAATAAELLARDGGGGGPEDGRASLRDSLGSLRDAPSRARETSPCSAL